MVSRTVVLTTSYPAFPGDACGHFVEAEARGLARYGDVIVVTAAHRHEDMTPDALASADPRSLAVLRLDGHGAFGWPGAGSLVRARPELLLGAARWALAARRALRRVRPLDRIVAHWAVPSAWPILAEFDVPLEVVSHGADVRLLLALPSQLRHIVVEHVLRRVEVWRFVSLALLRSMIAALDDRVARALEAVAQVRECPIELPDVRAAVLANRWLRGQGPLVVCVGRLVPSKRVEQVIDFVATRLSPGTRLVVVGDGPLRTRLEARARARGVDARFVGQTTRSAALAWIGAADAVLQASLTEGLSTVEREARALHVPFLFVDDAHAGASSVPVFRDSR